MLTGWRYRIGAIAGAAVLIVVAVFLANTMLLQELFTTYVPLFWRLDPILLTGSDLVLAVVLNALVVLAMMIPLYKPRPRRLLDTFFLAQKRVIVAGFALATLGYFNYSYRLPRATLTMTIGLLAMFLPLWFVWIRQRPPGDSNRAVLIGDDPDQITELLQTTDLPYVGYLCPTPVSHELAMPRAIADGGSEVRRLGGISRITDVLVEHDIDTAVLAFQETDRGEFFGALDTCYEHGVNAKVHRRFADSVMTDGTVGDVLVDVAIEPWDPQDYVFKRAFDVGFSAFGLILLSPLMAVLALAIRLIDGRPILYSQERTAGFGESYRVYKFRTMTPAEESADPEADQDRITRVGSVLRRTHLDEIPQLGAILLGRMSVVGPRAVWIEEEDLIEADIDAERWRQRWFVKPGLTGLAQINGVGSEDPGAKLRYDLEYIRRQSFWFDLKIVLRQLWLVLRDVLATMTGTRTEATQ